MISMTFLFVCLLDHAYLDIYCLSPSFGLSTQIIKLGRFFVSNHMLPSGIDIWETEARLDRLRS